MNKLFTLFLLVSFSFSCKKGVVSVKPPSKIEATDNFAKGADVSWITQMEAEGKKFYDFSGKEMEAMSLLKSLGMNTVRLRVWVNPTPAYNNSADVLAKAIRAKKLGLRIMIDFHYSDNWADPGQQTKPAAWKNLDSNGLNSAITTHTIEVLSVLKTNEISPEWVQVGNETNDGMLWPEGRASTNPVAFAKMINAGYDGVKSVFPNAKVIVHLSNGYNISMFKWMFDGLRANGAKYDVIGVSLYPSYSSGGWATVNAQCLENMNGVVGQYGKEVMIVEVGMPWDSAHECKAFITDLIAKTRSVKDGKGLGVLYWEPQAYGNWQDYKLGAFDNSGKPTIALEAFK